VARRRSRAEKRAVLERSSSPREKAIELWSSVKHQLVEFSALPEYLRDNNYILGHYRVNYPFKRALLSVFTMHNETFNVWTYVCSSPFPLQSKKSEFLQNCGCLQGWEIFFPVFFFFFVSLPGHIILHGLLSLITGKKT
jgi:hypothetical protein